MVGRLGRRQARFLRRPRLGEAACVRPLKPDAPGGSATGRTLYGLSEPLSQRRRYDSPVRRQQVAETRERIVAAGAELLHGFPIWNWRALTVRAVAERAELNERTVYR